MEFFVIEILIKSGILVSFMKNSDRNYYREFGTSWTEQIKARFAYLMLGREYKLIVESNGKVMVGTNYKANEIAMRIFNAHLGKVSDEKRISILESIYRQKKGSMPHEISNPKVRKNILEMLCQDIIFDMVKSNTIREALARLNSPSQSASSGH